MLKETMKKALAKKMPSVLIVLHILVCISIALVSIVDAQTTLNMEHMKQIKRASFELFNKTMEVVSLSEDLNGTQWELTDSIMRIYDLKVEKHNISMCLVQMTKELEASFKEIGNLTTEIRNARKGDKYQLHDPTYDEMMDFLSADPVDNNTYQAGYYVCRHFAMDLRNHATVKGIRSAYVEFYGPRPGAENPDDQSLWRGHCLVGFDTTDKGFVYIEPQNDHETDVVEGETFGNIVIRDLLIIW